MISMVLRYFCKSYAMVVWVRKMGMGWSMRKALSDVTHEDIAKRRSGDTTLTQPDHLSNTLRFREKFLFSTVTTRDMPLLCLWLLLFCHLLPPCL